MIPLHPTPLVCHGGRSLTSFFSFLRCGLDYLDTAVGLSLRPPPSLPKAGATRMLVRPVHVYPNCRRVTLLSFLAASLFFSCSPAFHLHRSCLPTVLHSLRSRLLFPCYDERTPPKRCPSCNSASALSTIFATSLLIRACSSVHSWICGAISAPW